MRQAAPFGCEGSDQNRRGTIGPSDGGLAGDICRKKKKAQPRVCGSKGFACVLPML